MNYKEKTEKSFNSFIKTSYGSKAYWWGQLLPLMLTIATWTAFFTLILNLDADGANYIELAKSVAFFIGGVISTCTLCIGNMLMGLMFKSYTDSIEKDK